MEPTPTAGDILTDDYLAEAERRARRFSGAWTGTSGSLAADLVRCVKMIRALRRESMEAEMEQVGGMTQEQMEAAWSAVRARHQAVHQAIAKPHEAKREEDPPAAALLMKAYEAVHARRSQYGPPLEHFARTVGMVNAAFGHKLREPLTAADWALVMVLDKIARHLGPGRSSATDSLVDIAGYAGCCAEAEPS